jgi:hypothetical protein
MKNSIQSAVEKTLSIVNVKATILVTPSTISFEDIANESDAKKIESAFVKAGMRSLGTCDMKEIEMGEGFSLTIAY